VLREAGAAEGQVPDEVIDRLLDLLAVRDENRELLARLARQLNDAEATAAVGEITNVLDALDAAGIPATSYAVDVAMVRGLDYYTGTIFETAVTRPPIGSITGGGRYDRLVSLFGRDMPAVGTSFGVDRLVDVMDEVGLFPADVAAPAIDVLVTLFDAATTAASIDLAGRLRRAGVRTELYLTCDGIGNQIRYALRRGIPCVAICGPDEVAAGTVTLRDLAAQQQSTLPIEAAVAELRRDRSDVPDLGVPSPAE